MKKVSVLIPIYNVERYIEHCVRSLMEQTLDNIEYIFVNDCTPDDSMKVLKRVIADYPSRQNDIHIISHTSNKGLASVRNTGLDVATGEYIICCDSDDWIDPNMYEDMYNKAKETNADIVVTDFYYEYSSSSKLCRQPYPSNNIQCVSDMLSGKLHCGTWNKLIRRELFLKNNISFPDGVNMWEDVATMIPICYYSKKTVYLPKVYYHYVQTNNNSYTKNKSDITLGNMMKVIEILENFITDNNIILLRDKLCYKKLTVKLELLINSRGDKQKYWNNIYKESTPYIFLYSQMSLYWRLALKFASWRMLFLFNLMANYASILRK